MKYLKYTMKTVMVVDIDNIAPLQEFIDQAKTRLDGDDDEFEVESVEVVEDDI
jgi:hypothetical protein